MIDTTKLFEANKAALSPIVNKLLTQLLDTLGPILLEILQDWLDSRRPQPKPKIGLVQVYPEPAVLSDIDDTE